MPSPTPKELEKRLGQLEAQVRQEVDLRILAFMLELNTRVRQILNEDEIILYTDKLGEVLENPAVEMDAPVQAVFDKLLKDETSRQLFEHLSELVLTKHLANQIEQNPRPYPSPALQNNPYITPYENNSTPKTRRSA